MATTRTAGRAKKARVKKAAQRTISNAQLLKLAAKHRPPQAWFEETDLPFKPAKR